MQSVAVRLVVDREMEIDAFVPVESWTIDALLVKDGINPFTARLVGRRGDKDTAEREKLELGTEAEAKEVIAALGLDDHGAVTARTPAFIVQSIEVKERSSLPQAPHTTSTLQQDASSRLGMPPKRAMSIAQQLYEGVDLGSAGSTGLITYMRTDSIRISDAAKDAARKHITTAFGKEYVGTGAVRGKKAALNVQDAHEAIRPTDVSRTPESVSADLSRDQLRLYDLIWRRFVASRDEPREDPQHERTDRRRRLRVPRIRVGGHVRGIPESLEARGRQGQGHDASRPRREGTAATVVEITSEQHFTQPPPRYTEATLIKELEERGIGRPSTYAATIEVIQERQYVKQVERRLHPTELGKTVDTVLRQNFPDIVDIAFTADLEKRLELGRGRHSRVRADGARVVRAVCGDARARRALDGACARPGAGDRRGMSRVRDRPARRPRGQVRRVRRLFAIPGLHVHQGSKEERGRRHRRGLSRSARSRS